MTDRDPGDGFAGVRSRGSVDYLVRNTQQELVSLSSQSDTKASILITSCSVVLTVGAALVRDTVLTWAFGVLAAFLLVALCFAVLCVLPSFTNHIKHPIPPERRNPLFFGHFGYWTESEFIDLLGTMSLSDEEVYAAQARDLYAQGTYLVSHKYRFLRYGYATFLAGFVASAVVAVVSLAA